MLMKSNSWNFMPCSEIIFWMTFANFKFADYVISVLGLQILISRHRISQINLLCLLVYGCMEIVHLLFFSDYCFSEPCFFFLPQGKGSSKDSYWCVSWFGWSRTVERIIHCFKQMFVSVAYLDIFIWSLCAFEIFTGGLFRLRVLLQTLIKVLSK